MMEAAPTPPALTEAQAMRRELVAEKHAQAIALLGQRGLDCWLTFAREGSDLLLPYVIGGEYIVGTSALLLFANGPSVAIVADYDVGQVEGVFDRVIPYSRDWKEPLQTVLRERDPVSIGLNYAEHDHGVDGLTHGLYLALVAALVPLGFADRLVSAEPVAATVRAVKTRSEIERIRRACEITQRIFDDVTGMLTPGLSEAEIAEIFRERMQTYEVAPAWDASFCPAVFSTRSQPGHAAPGATRIERGDGLRVDFGVVYQGYASDMQREWYLLKPGETAAPAEFRHAFETVRDGILMAAELLKPGVRGYDVDNPVRQFVADRGYTFTHELGHQLGRWAHDGGMVLGPDNERYGARSQGVVEAGMVFTLEPCVASAMLEDDVVVTDNGCEFLVPTQREIRLVG
jgi:Xaa-Pro aminopeptidase